MRYYLLIFLFAILQNLRAQSNALFELRIYYCEPTKLEALVKRFSNHTLKLFEKHGMTNEGYWLPVKNDSNALYYILSYPDLEARNTAWANFSNDPKWKKVKAKSEKKGKIVKSVTSIFMSYTDYSMLLEKTRSTPAGAYELRSYYLNPGKLIDINNRFKNFTIKSFEGFGMTNYAYWNTIEADKTKQPILIYLLGHDSEAAAKKSFADFMADPERKKVFDASELNGKIIEKIESVFLKPLHFSKLK